MLRYALAVFAALSVSLAATNDNGNILGPDDNGKYTIQAEGIRASFIPYGAALSNLFVKDINGIERDIVLGFDNATAYSLDKNHPYYGGVPGRYANRIKNSTFTIDGVDYHILPNENGGKDTLHGGPNGWDWRNFTVVSHTSSSITFSIVDPDGEQGFPGEVISYVTYNVAPFEWSFKIVALATTKKTPIMLSSHVYWNLDAFQNDETHEIHNHTLHLPYSGQRIGVDSILIPDGNILANIKGSVNDFWSAPKQLGSDLDKPEMEGNCGGGCRGYDNCYLVSRGQDGPYDWRTEGPVASLHSPFSGIQVDVFSDQEAFQIYSCPKAGGAGIPIKSTQGFFDKPDRPRVVTNYSCVVMEVEDWIDAINHPEWLRGKKHIFGPEDGPYVLEAIYKFSAHK